MSDKGLLARDELEELAAEFIGGSIPLPAGYMDANDYLYEEVNEFNGIDTEALLDLINGAQISITFPIVPWEEL